jgi:hypothetical protein
MVCTCNHGLIINLTRESQDTGRVSSSVGGRQAGKTGRGSSGDTMPKLRNQCVCGPGCLSAGFCFVQGRYGSYNGLVFEQRRGRSKRQEKHLGERQLRAGDILEDLATRQMGVPSNYNEFSF